MVLERTGLVADLVFYSVGGVVGGLVWALGFALLIGSAAMPVLAQQAPVVALPDAATIMARVGANQDRSVAERARFVYLQHARVSSRKGKTVRCEEVTDARVVPTATGSKQELVKLDGRMLLKGRYETYTHLPAASEKGGTTVEGDEKDPSVRIEDDATMDRDLVESMRENLTDSKSKDGIGAGLFPLTTKIQAEYAFHLVGQETMNGRAVYHLTFAPKDKSDFGWKGDAYIDVAAYEPVVVRTTMSRKIPLGVRALLGTSLPGLGFSVVYAPQDGGVWFPVRFGTEFKVKVLFLFHREVVLGVENKAFERTHGDARIVGVGAGD